MSAVIAGVIALLAILGIIYLLFLADDDDTVDGTSATIVTATSIPLQPGETAPETTPTSAVTTTELVTTTTEDPYLPVVGLLPPPVLEVLRAAQANPVALEATIEDRPTECVDPSSGVADCAPGSTVLDAASVAWEAPAGVDVRLFSPGGAAACSSEWIGSSVVACPAIVQDATRWTTFWIEVDLPPDPNDPEGWRVTVGQREDGLPEFGPRAGFAADVRAGATRISVLDAPAAGLVVARPEGEVSEPGTPIVQVLNGLVMVHVPVIGTPTRISIETDPLAEQPGTVAVMPSVDGFED